MGKDLIALQNAHATQLTSESNGVSEWVIKDNENNELHRLPKEFTEKQIAAILSFAKKFELIALNAGADHQRERSNAQCQNQLEHYKKQLEQARMENMRLAEKLEKFIIFDDE